MTDSGLTSSTSEPLSGSQFPFPGAPPVHKTSETILNPEGRPTPVPTPMVGGPMVSVAPEADLYRLLFPDLSQLTSGDLPPSPSGIKLAHFEIVDRIGSGGMGSVFLALDLHLQRYVALKILAPSQAREPSAVQRFLNEARAAARLDYDGISRVHFYGEDRGFHFIAFEYVTGTNVRELIQHKGSLPPGDAINFTLQMAHALRHTSAAGVVHRDIKPSNIIVNPAGRAKLVDLGLARKESSESMDDLTVAGTTLGTFDYISPEQAQDPRDVDVRSDIYSLGCTLFHMLTGEAPYPQGTLAQKLLEHQQEYVPNPAELSRRVPAQLAAVTQKMMASDPRRRYQSPDSLIHDLLLVANTQGLKGVTPEGLVWSEGVQHPGQRFLVRHAGWLAAVTVLLAIVFAIDRFDRQRLNPVSSFPQNSTGDPTGTDSTSNTLGNSEINHVAENRVGPDIPPGEADPDNLITMTPGVSETMSGTLPDLITQDPDRGSILQELLNPDGLFQERSVPGTGIEPLVAKNSNSPETTVQIPLAFPGDLPETVEASAGTVASTAPPLPEDSQNTTEMSVENRLSPFTLWSPGISETQNYETLEAACANARNGSIIELQYDGFLEDGLEKPISITNDITIRAAKNFQPVIEFASRSQPDESDTRMITIRDGSLNLVNVHLYLSVKHGVTYPSRDSWTMFSLQGPDQLSLNHVTATIENADREPAAMFETVRGLGSELDKMKMKLNSSGAVINIDPFVISVEDSVLRGEFDTFLIKSARPGQIRVERSLVVAENSLLRNLGSTDMPGEANELELNLSHTTVITGTSPVRFDSGEDQRFLIPVSLSTEDSLYALNPAMIAPLVSMTGATNPVDLRNSLRWYGHRNYYHGFDLFWTVADDFGSSELSDLDFEEWLQYWSDDEETFDENSVSGQLTWTNSWGEGDAPFSKVKPTALQIQMASDNQQDLLASDGTILGAALDQLPTPPSPDSNPASSLD